ncbi:MAG TPA: LPS assembly protein LptD, partial [Acetobacteraceae bacterium]|nr:LPS assembly protein LptD [Acetobacteraceae bacterium]
MRRHAGSSLLLALSLASALATSVEAQGVLDPVIAPPQSVNPILPGTPAPVQGAPARTPGLPGMGRGGQPAGDEPVTFTAAEVEYNRETGVVTARGRVEAWQGERILRADEFTYNRGTGVATATGNVQILEPDGQVIFAQSAVLSNQMRDAVIEGLRAYLAQNGRMAANGARRTNERIFDLSRVVYSACDLCPGNPDAPPLWQVRARTATLDREAGQVRYRDAAVLFGGVPLLYTPYLQHPDGSTPRQSGFLSPSFGVTRLLGGFVEIPYYWAIDASQDLLLTPVISSRQAPNLGLDYRRRFNFGEFEASGSIGYRNGRDEPDERGFGGHIFARGRFSIDENWRTGFDVNRASSELYLRTWRYGARRVLPSSLFAEGFWGSESFARIDARAYQGLRRIDDISQIPFVLPNVYFDWVAPTDALGGTFSFDTWNFAVFRDRGTDTRRVATRLGYVLPRVDEWGGVWALRLQSDLAAYSYDGLNLAPNFVAGAGSGTETLANIRAAVDWRMPFVRSAGEWGHQVIEPRVQIVTGPNMGRQTRIPNEDSIDFEFTDANFFALNRFYGRDRQEGGTRVDAALRGAWYFPNGGMFEGLVGRSFRLVGDAGPFYANSGLERQAS